VQRLNSEESEARAQELREKTRLRMQQHSREQREQSIAEREAQLKQEQEEAQAIRERQYQAQINQQKAKARAAEFKQRMRLEEEARLRMEEEQVATEQERGEAARLDRLRKRQCRPGDPVPAAQPPVVPASSSSAKAPQARAKQMPPRPPEMRGERADPEAAGGSSVRMPSEAARSKSQSRQGSRGVQGAPQIRRVNSRKLEAQGNPRRSSDASEVFRGKDIEREDAETAWSPAVDDGDIVRCNVGFFGVCNDPLDEEDAMEDSSKEDSQSLPPAGLPRVPDGYAAKASRLPSRGSSRGSTRAPSAPAPPLQPTVVVGGAARALSQPPLARNSYRSAAIDSPADSRDSSPRWNPVSPLEADIASGGLPRSPGAGSSFSEPTTHSRPPLQASPAHHKPTPWKQKAIKVQSADYFLDAMKAARGQKQAPGQKSGPGKNTAGGYAAQVRQRASDVEVQQREEEDARMEKGYAALQRVQQRGLQASPMRSDSG